MNAAGTLGFAPDPRAPIAWADLGAFITNPISLRSRSVTAHPKLVGYPGGFLLHTGLPNPGFPAVLANHARRWAEAALPIIVHLLGDRPEEAAEMTQRLEGLDNILAVELGFAPLLSEDIVLLAIEVCRGELPLIACLPPDQVLRLGPRAMEAGAATISIAAPRGALAKDGAAVSGRLVGPALFPSALEIVRSAARIGLPCVGAGGIFSKADVQSMLDAGAAAVQIDAALWLPRDNAQNLVA